MSHRIVIVGAGLSGTLVAVNLLRAQHWGPTRITLLEKSGNVGRGKAYAEREFAYRLNVPAGRMSADPTSPLDFLMFAQNRLPEVTAEDFLPRALYGEYLEATLLDAEVSAAPHVEFERLQVSACNLIRHPTGNDEAAQYSLELADGRTINADDVVLALGNPPPANLPGTERLTGYVADPWARPMHFEPDETVLLVGTGLTMVDMALAAAAASNDQVNIHAISRHGLIPPSQTEFSHAAFKGNGAALLQAASFSMLTLFRSIRELADDTERHGGDWRQVITFVRNTAPALWQRLPAREKRRLLRHVRPYWDVHRHRLPNESVAKLDHLKRRDKLHVHAARLQQFEQVGDKVHVTWRARGAEPTQTLLVDRVINCTGPNYDISRSEDPLLQSLVAQGLASPDPLHLGLRTGRYGALIDGAGRASHSLFYVGPMLRADYWEATAAAELRGHAERLASYLAAPVGRGASAVPAARPYAVRPSVTAALHAF